MGVKQRLISITGSPTFVEYAREIIMTLIEPKHLEKDVMEVIALNAHKCPLGLTPVTHFQPTTPPILQESLSQDNNHSHNHHNGLLIPNSNDLLSPVGIISSNSIRDNSISNIN